MIECSIWWLLTLPPWRKASIFLALTLLLTAGSWLALGRPAVRDAARLKQQQHAVRKQTATCLHQLAQLPPLSQLHARQRQQQTQIGAVANRDISFSLLFPAAAVRLLHWQTSAFRHSLQVSLAWEQLAMLMQRLVQRAPGASIIGFSLQPHKGELQMDMVVEGGNAPAGGAAISVTAGR
ncbi:hypothetical protein BL250_05930 [Erwinia sp. OLTSP20]|uniref:HofO family protein n=1 Tax=unclassified Erwinia TaxID=2622719 RepID=UPI000C19B749|nr:MULTISPECIES: hypothetical protein [unclassified Erwinia]PIJ51202.1 hypothetical protein BV501_05390 [Erwinia sp. OAMSP11]PIJ73954.1 hypothetical protein BK416_05665 [Erwinia sp. OLSSP12]PIJ83962.1 hypothetical protein BLD47_03290 [Erwinia sp. OLCASP19]PIJ86492.1 hypothetical protein BLD46_03570 [Erwinia sp. OLMTSP26]PIJ87971.1 hypothetical protein BLD49_04250 [Erwinia sp. OLMDSP33]